VGAIPRVTGLGMGKGFHVKSRSDSSHASRELVSRVVTLRDRDIVSVTYRSRPDMEIRLRLPDAAAVPSHLHPITSSGTHARELSLLE
jgi:hypothetical protein